MAPFCHLGFWKSLNQLPSLQLSFLTPFYVWLPFVPDGDEMAPVWTRDILSTSLPECFLPHKDIQTAILDCSATVVIIAWPLATDQDLLFGDGDFGTHLLHILILHEKWLIIMGVRLGVRYQQHHWIQPGNWLNRVHKSLNHEPKNLPLPSRGNVAVA